MPGPKELCNTPEIMKILVTGGAGFIGSNLATHLRRVLADARIVCMDNLYRRGSELNLARLRENGVVFHWGDVRDPSTFPNDTFDFIVECSAEPSVLAGQDGDPNYLVQTNLVGAFHCLEKARQWKSELIFLSTSRVYPIDLLESHPWRECETRFVWEDEGTTGITREGVREIVDMTGARSLYGFTKYAGEQLVAEYRAAYGLKAIVNRCGVVAGPWQFGKVDQGVAALWVLGHYFRRPLSYIGFGGSGKQVRDFLHIDDLCRLVEEQIAAPDRWDGWVGNVAGGSENSASLCELTLLCEKVIGRTTSIGKVPETRPNDLRIFIADCTRLYRQTSWRPLRSLGQIVADTTEWLAKHEAALRNLQ
jgi:CDP-paratose 2-epimerase